MENCRLRIRRGRYRSDEDSLAVCINEVFEGVNEEEKGIRPNG